MPKPWNEQVILITGATNGIGYEAARAIAALRTDGVGPQVVVVGRSAEKTARRVEELRAIAGAVGGEVRVDSLLCDFESQASVRALSAAFRERYSRLDILLNNAGTVYEKRTVTVDGLEATFAVNHLGYFLLTNLLLDMLVTTSKLPTGAMTGGARVVNVASLGHRRGTMDFDDLQYEQGYTLMRAYCRSKLGNVLFTRELARRLKGTGVTATALHPGTVATGIWERAPAWIQPLLWLPRHLFFSSPEEGGAALAHAATGTKLEGVTRAYIENGKACRASPLALDDAVGVRLWDVSAGLCGLT